MKNRGTILLIAATLMLIDVPVEAAVSAVHHSKHPTVTSDLFGRKRKGARPRRGGLFNTGLFRKKNACGCPSH